MTVLESENRSTAGAGDTVTAATETSPEPGPVDPARTRMTQSTYGGLGISLPLQSTPSRGR
jgi:hypothetical protein